MRDLGPRGSVMRRMGVVVLTGLVLAAGPALAPASATAAPTTTLESAASNGALGDGDSEAASVSADGRWVAFSSLDDNLVSGDTNSDEDVFLRDQLTGQTQRISVGPGGVQANGSSDGSSISANGRYVLFASQASNLVSGASGERLYL
jgi:hypothetical protein